MTGKEEVGRDGMPSVEGKCPVVGWDCRAAGQCWHCLVDSSLGLGVEIYSPDSETSDYFAGTVIQVQGED